MKSYGYFLVFLFNLIGTYFIAVQSSFPFSIIYLFSLYGFSTVVFLVDWQITQPKRDLTAKDQNSANLRFYIAQIVFFGDRIMALALISVLDILTFAIFIPETEIQVIEANLGVPLILLLLTLFFIPSILLKLKIEVFAKKAEVLIFQRFKEEIIKGQLKIPNEIFRMATQAQIRKPEPEPIPSNDGLVLYAYPSQDQQEGKIISESRKNIPSDEPSAIEKRQELLKLQTQFLASVFPELKDLFERTPVSVQAGFFLSVLDKILKNDPSLLSKIFGGN